MSFLFYHQLEAVCFDEEYARLRGVSVELFYILLLCLTALTIVTLLQIVGIVMVIALLSLPAATAAIFSKQLWQTILLASGLTLIYMIGGLGISYSPDLPAGATIILFSGCVYLVVVVVKPLAKKHGRKTRSS